MDGAHPFQLTGMIGAVLSEDRRHRYWLWRVWDRERPVLVTCMFNPSTADGRSNDPTIIRLCRFATRWGYGGVLVVNLHSLRSPHPAIVREAGPGSRGDAQAQAVEHAIALAADQGTPILVAWGNLAAPADSNRFVGACVVGGVGLICLGTTAGGAPKHPMARGVHRVPDDQDPVPFTA